MSKKKIVLIILVVVVISISVRFFTADVILSTYRIPEEQGTNYLVVTDEILKNHPKINDSLKQADDQLPLKTNSEQYDYRAASQFPPTILISNSEAREILSNFGDSAYESNFFYMFKKFYLNQDDKYYDSGIMICFIVCGANY